MVVHASTLSWRCAGVGVLTAAEYVPDGDDEDGEDW
jgi:hypothetical protein